MLSTFLSSLRSQNLSIYSSPSHQSVPTLPRSINLPDFFGVIPEAASNFRVNELCRDVADETDEWLLDLLNKVGYSSSERKEESHKETISLLSEKLKPSLLAACLFPGAGRTQLRLCSELVACLLMLENQSLSLRRRDGKLSGEGNLGAVQISEAEELALCLQGLQNVVSYLRRNTRFMQVAVQLETSVQSLSESSRTSQTGGTTRAQEAATLDHIHKSWLSIPIGIIEYALDMDMDDSTVRQLTKAPLAGMREMVEEILYDANIVYSIAGQFCHARRHLSSSASGVHATQRSVSMQRLWDECEKEYDVSSQRCLQHIRDFVALQAEVLQFSPEAGAGVGTIPEQYAKALGHYVRGFLQWCFETEHYFGDEGERIRVTLRVPIDEDEEQATQTDGEEQ